MGVYDLGPRTRRAPGGEGESVPRIKGQEPTAISIQFTPGRTRNIARAKMRVLVRPLSARRFVVIFFARSVPRGRLTSLKCGWQKSTVIKNVFEKKPENEVLENGRRAK